MVCQSETIRLLQVILNKLGPLQAETARYATQQPIGCQPSADVIPMPSAPLTDSALFVHPAPSAPSAGQKEPFQVFYEPLPPSEFNGDRSAGMTFWASCWSCICYDPETFPDDATKIYWVMSHMTTGRAGRWAARELDHGMVISAFPTGPPSQKSSEGISCPSILKPLQSMHWRQWPTIKANDLLVSTWTSSSTLLKTPGALTREP